jgi:crotonobetainyl-CoA:carnitine CoA-transferase CaiB-like acyl-CoA transferase
MLETVLGGLRVIDTSTEVAGPYATKLLADAGADVVKVEAAEGDPLRRWTAVGVDLPIGEDSALFRFLNASKRSVVGEFGDLAAGADVVIGNDDLDAAGLSESHPHLVVLTITPFGRTGPWADRPATEFTLQAACGSTGSRGRRDRPPLAVGGRFGEFQAGVNAAVAAVAAWRAGRADGVGERVDLSMLESMALGMNTYGPLFAELYGVVAPEEPAFRHIDHPSIEPTADGWVGFATIANQQFKDFLVLIERGDLLADEALVDINVRTKRAEEFEAAVQAWTTRHPTEEIIRRASELRVPVAPIGDGATVIGHEQFVARKVFVNGPHGRQPRVPYRMGDHPGTTFGPAPALGAHTGIVTWDARPAPAVGAAAPGRPLAGVRIVDLTCFWAGPSASVTLAALGADVVKVEAVQRPDGMRFTSTRPPTTDRWWEWAPVFCGTNAGKRGITLDLATAEGRGLLLDLVRGADALLENFSPRVMEQFDLDWPVIHAADPRVVMVRMPGFGLDGPWRDRTGYAPTMEQLTGLAFITGWPDLPPIVPRGPCDPLAGQHAAFALLVALEERDQTGEGLLLEVPMVEAALATAAGPIVEAEAYGIVQQREGNRSPVAAPQGVYGCAEQERWVAVAVTSDGQWVALCAVLGRADLATDPTLAEHAGRRAAQERLDDALAEWAADQPVADAVAALVAAGVPCAEVVSPGAVDRNPQLVARGFFEPMEREVVGLHHIPSLPYRFASRGDAPWHRTPAPLIGEHNDEVLGGQLGLGPDALERLRNTSVIGDRPLDP